MFSEPVSLYGLEMSLLHAIAPLWIRIDIVCGHYVQTTGHFSVKYLLAVFVNGTVLYL
jgi:tetrahydromethanopterin S-methyltransferase subunit A